MSSNNNTGSIEAVFFACILGGLFFIGLFVIFVLALICAIATVVALASWNHPIRIGSLQVEAGEGRAFVLRGLLGSLVLPAFMLFAYTVLDIRFVV